MRARGFGSPCSRIRAAGTLTLFLALCLTGPLAGTTFAQNPVPLINQPLVPAAVAPGGPSFTLTVNGTGFVPESVVNWNGSPRPTTLVSSSQLTAAIDAADIATMGTAWVTVVNPSPGGGTSNVAYFHVTIPASIIPLSETDYTVAGDHVFAVSADFNRDGKLDLAAATQGASAVSILLGNGDGTFQPHVDLPTCGAYMGPAVGDFNGDGKADLAVSCFGAVSILLGNGDGTFQPHVDYPAGGNSSSVAVGDFDGDGKIDLAVVNLDLYNAVSILLGNGDGSFQPPVSFPTGYAPYSLTVGEFNGDGFLDLAVTNHGFGGYGTTVSVLLGNGDGTFQFHVDYSTGEGPISVLASDFDGDGKIDLATANQRSGTISVLLGNGNGTFRTHVNYPTGAYPFWIVAGDFNADGKLDLGASHNDSPGAVSLLLGNGDGTFQAELSYPTRISNALGMTAGDFNDDGRLDVAAGARDAAVVSVLVQTPVVEVSSASLTFGSQSVGTTSAPQSVTLTNYTFSPLTIDGIVANGDFGVTHNCPISPVTLAVGHSCTLEATFTPTAHGVRNGDVTITDDAPSSPQVIELSGTGLGPTASLSPTSITFGNQYVGTTGLPQTVTLTNNGNAPLTITSVTASGDFGVLNACTSNVNPGVSCAIGVFFDPSATGTRTGTLTVTDDAPDSPQTASLSGTGVDFSMATTTPSSTISAGQLASYPLTVSPVAGFSGTVSLNCRSVPPLSTCSVSPSSVALNGGGSASATVTVTTTAPSAAGPTFGGPREDRGRRRAPQQLPLQVRLVALAMLVGLTAVAAVSQRRPMRAPASPVRTPALQWVPLAGALLLVLLWAACGGGGGGGGGNPGTPPGTYTLTVTGTVTTGSGNLSHDLTLTLKVN